MQLFDLKVYLLIMNLVISLAKERMYRYTLDEDDACYLLVSI